MKGRISLILCVSMLLSSFINIYSVDEKPQTAAIPEQTKSLSVNIQDAVKTGIQNSIALKQVQNEIDYSKIQDEKAGDNARSLKKGEDNIDDGQQQLNQAKSAVANGTLPFEYNGHPAGTPINSLSAADQAGVTNYLQTKQQQIDNGQTTLDDALNLVGSEAAEKLNVDDISLLTSSTAGNLMTTMSGVSLEVTKASYDIYKNQIALLIQKNYYDALKAQKILDVKKKAVERAEKQHNFAKDSYNAGMKAKDDMLLANTYYQGTLIEQKKAEGDLNNAFLELKKNMNIPLDTQVTLTDVLAEEVQEYNLNEGIAKGMKSRLEIKKTLGEVVVYSTNFEAIKQNQPDITYNYREAALKKEKAIINYDKTKVDVEASIRQSYETLKSTGEMLNLSKQMVEQSRESVDIAEYRYKEGIGVDSSLLQKLDLQSSGGTILEVLAAEENLSQVEEKVVEITYGYNLAKMKYLNDAGILVY